MKVEPKFKVNKEDKRVLRHIVGSIVFKPFDLSPFVNFEKAFYDRTVVGLVTKNDESIWRGRYDDALKDFSEKIKNADTRIDALVIASDFNIQFNLWRTTTLTNNLKDFINSEIDHRFQEAKNKSRDELSEEVKTELLNRGLSTLGECITKLKEDYINHKNNH